MQYIPQLLELALILARGLLETLRRTRRPKPRLRKHRDAPSLRKARNRTSPTVAAPGASARAAARSGWPPGRHARDRATPARIPALGDHSGQPPTPDQTCCTLDGYNRACTSLLTPSSG